MAGNEPRERLKSLKTHVPENHGNHPDNKAMFRKLRNISDQVNDKTRFNFDEIETEVDVDEQSHKRGKSRSDPFAGQHHRSADSRHGSMP